MAAEIQLKIAHVLSIDIVGYFADTAFNAVCRSTCRKHAAYACVAPTRSGFRSAARRSAPPKATRFCLEIIMAAEVKKEIELEIAHVLFADIVGYSKLPMWERALSMVRGDGVSRVGQAGVPANARGDMQPYQETGERRPPRIRAEGTMITTLPWAV